MLTISHCLNLSDCGVTPRTSLLEHSVPSTIKEVPAELESNCARAAILQIEPASVA